MSGQARSIVWLFLTGVAVQILVALLNKWTSWIQYNGLDPVARRWPKFYRAVDWFSEQFWLDMLLDLAALVAFGWATAVKPGFHGELREKGPGFLYSR